MSAELVQFDKVKAELTVFVQPVFTIKVSDQDTGSKALDAARTVKAFDKRIEEMRKALVKPLNDQVDAINAYAKKIREPLQNAEKHLKAELATWEKELEKQRQEELRKAEEERKKREDAAAAEAQAKKEEADTLAMFGNGEQAAMAQAEAAAIEERHQEEEINFQKQTVANISTMKVFGAQRPWTFEVTDATAVPREFLVIDDKAIRAAVRSGARDIAGLRIFQDTRISIR